jgi:hypothetical protein
MMVLDEETFMREVAARLNAFLDTYPSESQHVLSQFIEYKHELVGVHTYLRAKERKRQGKPVDHNAPPPGINVAQLFAALLQTHQGNGWVLRPIFLPDPDSGPGYVRIHKFVAERQEDLELGPKS